MSMYEELDKEILGAVKVSRLNPVGGYRVGRVAARIADLMGRETYRVIDARLQALRKAGKIVYLKKADAPDGKAGWYLAEKLEAKA